MYDYGYGYGSDYGTEAVTSMLGIFGVMYVVMTIFSLVIGLIAIISYAKIFSKAGKPWWASIVPIYNIIVMLEIAKLPMWYIALFFVPFANIYALFKINIEIAKKFGKGTGFGVGMTLLSIIFIPLLAFSDNKYEDADVVPTNASNEFDATNVINNNVSVDNVNSDVLVAPIANVEVSPAPVEAVTIENNPFAPVQENVQATSIDVDTSTISASIEPAPAMDATIQNVESVVSEVPMENATVEQSPIMNVGIENVQVEPVIPVAPIEPIMTTPVDYVPVEPVSNAFNMTPDVTTTVEPVVNSIETINIPESNVVEQLNVNSTENDLATNLAEDKKLCKNCGNKLPDIVSICPNCGTDNE